VIESFIAKLAKWGVDLKPHQLRAHARLRSAPGVLVYHGLGSGKTITSITGADNEGRDAVAVVPAALRNNYAKEIHKVNPKQRFHVTSYEGFTKNPNANGKTLILDEGHRTKNSASSRSQALYEAATRAHKRIVLTGTPIPNQPEDLAPLMNIVSGKRLLPVAEDFRKKYLSEHTVSPGFFDRLRGVTPGIEYNIKNRSDLASKVRGLVDYHPSTSENFPSVSHIHRDVEMDPRQKRVYEHVMKNAPSGFFRKMERRLPPSKAEARNLNAFLTGARIVSNTPAPYQHDMTPEEGYHPI
jgi:SNF2 family DNA or RNA helicase